MTSKKTLMKLMKKILPEKENGSWKRYQCLGCKKNLSSYSSAKYHLENVKCVNDSIWY